MSTSIYANASYEVAVYDRVGLNPTVPNPSSTIWTGTFNPAHMFEVKHIDLNSIAAGREGIVVVTAKQYINDDFPAQLVIRGTGRDAVVNFMKIPYLD
jgi:hypothetical protein